MLGTREYTLCSPFRANAHNYSYVMGENTVLQLNILETGVLTLVVQNSSQTPLRLVGRLILISIFLFLIFMKINIQIHIRNM